MFSALSARGAVEGARVLDLFAGTGALAFEALSRGAERAVAVDDDRRARAAIQKDAEALGLSDLLVVVGMDLLGAPERAAERLARQGPFDLILADPPYVDAGRAIALLALLAEAGAADPDAVVVLEHATRDALELGPRLASVASYRYGDTSVELMNFMEPQVR